MASLSSKTTHQSLMKKGFKQAPGDDHKFIEFHYNGNFIAATHTSHGTKEIHDGIISAMSKQCKVNSGFFKQFATCTKSQEDYITELRKNGIITPQMDVVFEQPKPVNTPKKKKNNRRA